MERTSQHDELSVFLGKWTARGTSFGGTDQSGADPKTDGQQWLSTHEAYWHTGKFFLLQDERADISGSRFDSTENMQSSIKVTFGPFQASGREQPTSSTPTTGDRL